MREFDQLISDLLKQFWRSLQTRVESRLRPIPGWGVRVEGKPDVVDSYLAFAPLSPAHRQYLLVCLQQVRPKDGGLELILGVSWPQKLRPNAQELELPEVRELRKALQPRYWKKDRRWYLGYVAEARLTDLPTLQGLLSGDALPRELADAFVDLAHGVAPLLTRANDALRLAR